MGVVAVERSLCDALPVGGGGRPALGGLVVRGQPRTEAHHRRGQRLRRPQRELASIVGLQVRRERPGRPRSRDQMQRAEVAGHHVARRGHGRDLVEGALVDPESRQLGPEPRLGGDAVHVERGCRPGRRTRQHLTHHLGHPQVAVTVRALGERPVVGLPVLEGVRDLCGVSGVDRELQSDRCVEELRLGRHGDRRQASTDLVGDAVPLHALRRFVEGVRPGPRDQEVAAGLRVVPALQLLDGRSEPGGGDQAHRQVVDESAACAGPEAELGVEQAVHRAEHGRIVVRPGGRVGVRRPGGGAGGGGGVHALDRKSSSELDVKASFASGPPGVLESAQSSSRT